MQYLFKKPRQMKSLRKLKSNIEIKSYLLHHSEAKKIRIYIYISIKWENVLLILQIKLINHINFICRDWYKPNFRFEEEDHDHRQMIFPLSYGI